MKRLALIALFTFGVGLLSAQAQDQTSPSQRDEERVTQDTVIDNSNLPDTTIIDDSGMMDSTGTIHSNHEPGMMNKSNKNNSDIEPDKLKEQENLEGK